LSANYTEMDFWHDYVIYRENRARWMKITEKILWGIIYFLIGFIYVGKLIIIV